jgi:hypothetical protein
VIELLVEPLPEQVSEFTDGVPVDPRRCQFARRAETHIEQNVLRTCAPARFVFPTMDQRFESNTRAHIQRADAFRAIEFVASHGQEIDTQRSDLRRDLSHGLSRISMEEDSVLPRNPADVRDGLYGPDLVVGVHHGKSGSCPA